MGFHMHTVFSITPSSSYDSNTIEKDENYAYIHPSFRSIQLVVFLLLFFSPRMHMHGGKINKGVLM